MGYLKLKADAYERYRATAAGPVEKEIAFCRNPLESISPRSWVHVLRPLGLRGDYLFLRHHTPDF